MATGTCYRCSQFGHFSKDCMGKGIAQKPLAPAQVYALVLGEPKGGSKVVTGTAPILGFEALVSYDLVCECHMAWPTLFAFIFPRGHKKLIFFFFLQGFFRPSFEPEAGLNFKESLNLLRYRPCAAAMAGGSDMVSPRLGWRFDDQTQCAIVQGQFVHGQPKTGLVL
jgi:hypothetical protein